MSNGETGQRYNPDFNSRKTAFFQKFAVSHLSSFRPHYRTGETLGKKPEVWRNVSEHCLVAGVFADILSDLLRLLPEQKARVVRAALLHDWFKKHESIEQTTAQKGGTLTLQTLSTIKAKDSTALLDMGIPKDIVTLTGANIPESPEDPSTLPEKIIWYIDAMLSNTEPVSITQRFDDLERGWDGTKEDSDRAERNRAFSNLFNEKYAGQSLYDVQRTLGDKIGSEFASIIGYEGNVGQLPLFLKEKLFEKIQTS